MVKFPSHHFHSTDAYYFTPLCPAPSDIKAPVAFTECIHSPPSTQLATGSCAGGGNSTVAYQDARAASPLSRGRPQGAAARSTEVQVQGVKRGSNFTPHTAVFHSRPTTVGSGIPRIRESLNAGRVPRRGPPFLQPREAIEEIGGPLSVRQLNSLTAVGSGGAGRDGVNCLKCFSCIFAKEVKENRVELLKGPPLTASSVVEVDSWLESHKQEIHPTIGRGAAAAAGSRAPHQDSSQTHREAVSPGVQRLTSPVICHKVVTAELLSQNLRVPSMPEVNSADESTTDPTGRKVPSDLGATKRRSSAAGERLLAGIRRNRASAYAAGAEHYAPPVLGRAVDALLLRRRTGSTARNSNTSRSYTVASSISSPADIKAFGGHVISNQNVINQRGMNDGSKGTAKNSSEAGSSAPVVPPESTSAEWGELDTYSAALQQQGVLLQPAHTAPIMSEVVGRATVTPDGMDYSRSTAWSSTLPSNAASILKSAANVILRAPALRADAASPTTAYPSPSTQMPAALNPYVHLLPVRLAVPPLFRVTQSNFLASQRSTSSPASAEGENHAAVNRITDSKGQQYIASFYPGAAGDEARLTEIANTNTNYSPDAERATLPSRQEPLASALPLQPQGALKQPTDTGSIASSAHFSSTAAADADLHDDSNYGRAATANRAAVPEVLHSTAQVALGTRTRPEKQVAQDAVQMQKRGINSPSSQAPAEPLSHTGSCSTRRAVVPDSDAVAVATETRQSLEGAHAAPARTGEVPTITERFDMKGKETEITTAMLPETAATGKGNLEASQNIKEIRTAVPLPGSGPQTQAIADSAPTNSAVTQGGAPSSIRPSQEETRPVSTGTMLGNNAVATYAQHVGTDFGCEYTERPPQ